MNNKLLEIRPLHTTIQTHQTLRFGHHTLFTTVTDTLKGAPVLDRAHDQRQQLFFLVEPSSVATERYSNEFFGIPRVSEARELVSVRALLSTVA